MGPRTASLAKFVVGMVLMAVAAVLLLLTRPTPADAVAVLIDASHSVGADYRNKYLPTITSLLPGLIGKRLLIVRFGGIWEEIFRGCLQEEDVRALQKWLLGTELFPSHIIGSPISSATLAGVQWLVQQEGKRKVLLLFTDGMEQEGRVIQTQRVPRIEGNLIVVFCFPRTPNPISAEMARLTGASVRVAADQSTVQRYIEQLVLGIHPHHAVSKAVALSFALVGLAFIVLTLAPLLRKKQPVQEGATQEEAPPTLPSLDAEVVAQVIGQPHLRARRRLRRGDRFIIARQGVPDADLVLPLTLLGRFADFGIACLLEDGLTLRVHNFGRVPCIVGSLPLRPKETQQVDEASFVVRLPATDVEIAVTTQPAP